MPDILPVSLQDILYRRKPDLREQKVKENNGEKAAAKSRCLMHVSPVLDLWDRYLPVIIDEREVHQ